MRRVLLVQPSLQPPGGGNGAAAWILQALVADHDVTVLSWRAVDVDPINRFFGTSLQSADFTNVLVPPLFVAVFRASPVPAALLRSAILMRYTRRIAGAFDVVVGGHNETDYGRRGIQYVHYPAYLRPRPRVDLRWYHRPEAALRAYYRLADAVAGFSVERMKSNLSLANSNWTAAQLERALGIRARTLYPPVVDPATPVSWDARRPAFLAVGRLSPEKELERVMAILARVRDTHPAVTLTIVGTWDRHAGPYFRKLKRLASRLGPWITFLQDVPRDEVRRLMATHRYGIHGMREEHFGMAPAEMMRAGMIVWVPNGGGQVEIVGAEPNLVYGSEDDAVRLIGRVLDSATLQSELRDKLRRREALFGTARFVAEVREIVGTFTP